MDIVVTAAGPDAPRHRGLLTAGGQGIDCALGRAGITRNKREGDGATPSGRFALRRVLYRADRIAQPATKLPHTAIARDDGWCDDPASADYNRAIRFPYDASAEHLWREDALYDVVVVLGHNDDPPQPGAGSAIFLHVARDGLEATEGCIAIPRDALIALVEKLAPGDAVVITGNA